MLEIHSSKLLQDIQWLSVHRKKNYQQGKSSRLREDKIFMTGYVMEKTKAEHLSLYIGKQICELLEFNINDYIVPKINIEKHILLLKKNTESKMGYRLCEYKASEQAYKLYLNFDVLRVKGIYDCSGVMHESHFELFDDKSIVLSLENILKPITV